MLDPKFLEELTGKISALIAASPARDVEKNARALLAGAFSRLDLVSREEFDIQRELLVRARSQLDRLESRIAELEAQAGNKPGA
ncbi:MAG: accessory factor UbiK family protein [Rhodocyclaceae bacterium]|nr:accessory factor UbiK family protein [Rhodocyclaceae bacterium]